MPLPHLNLLHSFLRHSSSFRRNCIVLQTVKDQGIREVVTSAQGRGNSRDDDILLRSPHTRPWRGGRTSRLARRGMSRLARIGGFPKISEDAADLWRDPRHRRRFQRYEFSGRVTVSKAGSSGSTWGLCSDLGEGGLGATIVGEIAAGETVWLRLAFRMPNVQLTFGQSCDTANSIIAVLSSSLLTKASTRQYGTTVKVLS